MEMRRFGPFPYVPNMADCRRVLELESCTCYIMDTVCRNMTAEGKAAADEQILQIYVDHALKQGRPGSA